MTDSDPACLRLGRLTSRLDPLHFTEGTEPSPQRPQSGQGAKNAENRSTYLLPPIFLPDQASADGCDGSRPESDLGRIFDAGGLQERVRRAGKKMGGKKY